MLTPADMQAAYDVAGLNEGECLRFKNMVADCHMSSQAKDEFTLLCEAQNIDYADRLQAFGFSIRAMTEVNAGDLDQVRRELFLPQKELPKLKLLQAACVASFGN